MSRRQIRLTAGLILLVTAGLLWGEPQQTATTPAPCPQTGRMTVGQLKQLLAPIEDDLPVRIESGSSPPGGSVQVYDATGVIRRDTYLAICTGPIPPIPARPVVTEWRTLNRSN